MKTKSNQKFFKHLIGEMFLLLEVKKVSHSVSEDCWYLDVQRLVNFFKQFGRFYSKRCVHHPVLDLIIVAMVIIFFQSYFHATIRKAAFEIIWASKRKLICSKRNFMNFYKSIQHSITNILRVKCEFLIYY